MCFRKKFITVTHYPRISLRLFRHATKNNLQIGNSTANNALYCPANRRKNADNYTCLLFQEKKTLAVKLKSLVRVQKIDYFIAGKFKNIEFKNNYLKV